MKTVLFMLSKKQKNGFALVEILVSIAIVAMLGLTLQTLIVRSVRISRINKEQLQATLYLREMAEAARDLEQSDWASLTNPLCNTPEVCHFEISGGAWVLTAGSETAGKFTRSFSVHPVYRDQTDFPNIITEMGMEDIDTKKVVATVSWDSRTMTLETFAHNFPLD